MQPGTIMEMGQFMIPWKTGSAIELKEQTQLNIAGLKTGLYLLKFPLEIIKQVPADLWYSSENRGSCLRITRKTIN
jgi:hypothetical protein